MATIPDPNAIDWAYVGAWATGITTVVVSMGAAAWLAIRKAVQIAQIQPLPAPTVHTESKIITTDSVAMELLAGTLEASNTILTENNVLRKEEHNDRQLNREAIEANTAVNQQLLASLGEARVEIRELTREIVRLSIKPTK